jgi:hypothetical protein
MEDVFIHHHAAIVDLDVDEVGVDSVDSRTENLKKHGAELKRV